MTVKASTVWILCLLERAAEGGEGRRASESVNQQKGGVGVAFEENSLGDHIETRISGARKKPGLLPLPPSLFPRGRAGQLTFQTSAEAFALVGLAHKAPDGSPVGQTTAMPLFF